MSYQRLRHSRLPYVAVAKGQCLEHAQKPWLEASRAVIVAASFVATHYRRPGPVGSAPPVNAANAAAALASRSCSIISPSLTTMSGRLFSVHVATGENTDAHEWGRASPPPRRR
jgi:hypothetical protein